MVFGTPQEHYESDQGSAVLRSIDRQSVTVATENLLGRGVLSKLYRDPSKPKPGRHFKISEAVGIHTLIAGTIAQEIIQDANSLEETTEEEWRDWPLLASDGDIAALIELTSAGQVRISSVYFIRRS